MKNFLLIQYLRLFAPVLLGLCSSAARLQANAGEIFTYKIEPQLFNWPHQVISEQFRYRVSLKGYPDLPSWMRYMYSYEYQAGFLYGTPPDSITGKPLNLDVVSLNRKNYETRQAVITIYVEHKFPPPNVVQMKIDNLNWVHLMDPGRVEDLRNIFRNELWPESGQDLCVVFVESAVNMGGRLPLSPQEREGVIVHLGSLAKFSPRLKELQEEVRPLYKLPSCTYKRTSVQKLFENAGFKLDWCAFKIVGVESNTEIINYHNHGSTIKLNTFLGTEMNRNHTERWTAIPRMDVPTRNYIDEYAFAIAVPGMIFAVLIGFLSAVLCFQHEKLYDPHSEFFFKNIFHICEKSCENPVQDSASDTESTISLAYTSASTVQMVQCSDTNKNQPVTTLTSLKDPNFLLDDLSSDSQSPNNNFYQIDCNSSAFVRPKPPPYVAGSLSKNGVDI